MFGNPIVRTITLSRVFLQLGIWIRNFAVLLYVTELTNNSPFYVSLISVVEYVPIFLFALIGGTFADRWKPKLTMVGSDALSAISVLSVLLAVYYGQWAALLAGMFISASLSQFSQPSAMKLYKKHVPQEQLQGVMAISQSLQAIFMVIGPVIGTFIFMRYGVVAALVLTFTMFTASSVILAGLPRDSEESKGKQSAGFMADMASGVRYLWHNRSLRTLGAAFSVTGFAAGLVQPLLLFITMEKLGQDKSFLQWVMMSNGIAMLVGGGLIMGIAKRVKPQVLLATGLFVSAVCTIIVGFSTSLVLSMSLQVISGLFYPCIQVGIQTLIMRNTEPAYMGRVGGTITPLFMGMMVVGMSLSGYMKNATTLSAVYTASGTLLVIGALMLVPLIQDRRPIAVPSSLS